MTKSKTKRPAVTVFISKFPAKTRVILEKIRRTIQKAAPSAEEAMKYGIPTFTLNGNLVHFAGFKNHIGFYPAPSAIKVYKKELTGYGTSKGAIRFPMDKPIPYGLIMKITKFRVKENLAAEKKA